jgi:RES domain
LAGPDGTFGNRFDDPEGAYRVLYASSQRLGCFLETLARFRVDLKLYAELNEIAGDDDYVPLGQVPPEWAQRRAIGSAAHHGQYADIYGSEWIGRLRRELARDCVRLGIADVDASVLQGSAPRSVTQRASRIIYNAGFDGICYHSRYGHEIQNWGLFEPFKLEPQAATDVTTDDPDFQKALQIHGLQIRH